MNCGRPLTLTTAPGLSWRIQRAAASSPSARTSDLPASNCHVGASTSAVSSANCLIWRAVTSSDGELPSPVTANGGGSARPNGSGVIGGDVIGGGVIGGGVIGGDVIGGGVIGGDVIGGGVIGGDVIGGDVIGGGANGRPSGP